MSCRRSDETLSPAVKAVRDCLGPEPVELAVVLGSGLGEVAQQLEGAHSWSYTAFDCFPGSSVEGHAGRLLAGELHGRRTLVFQGRFHLYQGLSAFQVSIPVRLAHALGCGRMLLTNAVGGIHPELHPGRFMLVDDHINLLGDNPLRGLGDDAFVDLSRLYRRDLFAPFQQAAAARGIPLMQGVLAAVPGPSYETPAEVRALQRLGADAVSMSTVPEAIMAAYLKMEVLGLSFSANRAAGLGAGCLSHEEVLATGRLGARDLATLVQLACTLWCH